MVLWIRWYRWLLLIRFTKYNLYSCDFIYFLSCFTEKVKDEKVELKDALIRKAKKLFLQLLECPICKEYMSPPIYQCTSGHTVCSSCKTKLGKCSSCEDPIEKTRNYTLEELSKKVELPSGGDDKKNVKNDVGAKRGSEENGESPATKVAKK